MIVDPRFWYGIVVGAILLLAAQHFLLSKGTPTPLMPAYDSQSKTR